MKNNFKYIIICFAVAVSCFFPITGCSCNNPAEDAADTIEGMASQEEKAQDAKDAFNADADAKGAEADAIFEMVE